MIVNDNEGEPVKRGALESIASKLAPAGFAANPVGEAKTQARLLLTTSNTSLDS